MKKSVLYLQQSGLKVIAATEKSSENYIKTDYTGPVAIVMGSEEFGIDRQILDLADDRVQIPILGKILV